MNAYFPEAMARASEQMPAVERIEAALRAAGWVDLLREPYSVRDDLTDGFLFAGKHRPELYLSAKVRAASSTFRTLATTEEISEGCARLESDLRSGRFQRVRERYASELGDYLFLSASHS